MLQSGKVHGRRTDSKGALPLEAKPVRIWYYTKPRDTAHSSNSKMASSTSCTVAIKQRSKWRKTNFGSSHIMGKTETNGGWPQAFPARAGTADRTNITNKTTTMCIMYIYIYIYIPKCVYIYIYRERERRREKEGERERERETYICIHICIFIYIYIYTNTL